ncbi:MAG: thioesterase family protein [Actinobacteria bacterium]|nr:MAG: thioesterase family protein [Actinomycetota bacterium]
MAFYTAVAADRFVSSGYTRGPWDAAAQHAGPPAALLGRAVEAAARPGMRVTRMTFDIARPVPIAPLTVTTSVVRQGRSVMVVQAAIEPYMRGTALLIRTADGAAPQVGPDPSVRLDDAVAKPFFPVPYDVGYHAAMEVRFGAGSFREAGPATAWMRMRVPLVDGEQPSPLTRVLVAADSGNGVSNVLDFDRYLFVNADLTVHLLRYPAGEWVCLEAATSIDRAGIGLADTALHDEQGRIGRCAQSLFVARR